MSVDAGKNGKPTRKPVNVRKILIVFAGVLLWAVLMSVVTLKVILGKIEKNEKKEKENKTKVESRIQHRVKLSIPQMQDHIMDIRNRG